MLRVVTSQFQMLSLCQIGRRPRAEAPSCSVKSVLTFGEARRFKERTGVERGTETARGGLEPAAYQFDAFDQRLELGELALGHLTQPFGRDSVGGRGLDQQA